MSRVKGMAYLLLAAVLFWSVASFQIAAAQGEARKLSISSNFSNILANKGEEIRLPITVNNTGGQAEEVVLEIVSGPADWGATFRDRGYTIRGVFIPAGGSRDLDFSAKSPAEAKGGDYTFVFKASTKDKKVESSFNLVVGLAEKAATAQGITLTARYPVLRGPAGTSFVFGVDLRNDTDKDRSFDLAARIPQGWEIGFRPAFEQEKQISTVRVEAGTTRSLDIQAVAPSDAKPAEYPISLRVSSGDVEDIIDLKADVTGSYGLILSTPTGKLNTEATAGRDSNFSLTVTSSGTADVQNISFSSSKPDGWVVTFEPAQLQSLQAGGSREVNVKIRPADKAIAGDYSVAVRVNGDRATDQEEIRVSVQTPTVWGWVGVVIVLLVIAGLAGIFFRLGRR